MERNISFNNKESYTIEEFKKMNGADKLDIIQNPETKKYFLACARVRGKVSAKVAAGDYNRMMVTLCESPEDAAPFWMLHNTNEPVNAVASF
jgi:hypothetical protein